ncbi:MAG: RDD family protein [Candidatus Deferrimicrobiaceae bacterium]
MSMMMEEHHYAGFWIRLFARVIDLILILATFNLFFLVDQMGADAGLWAPSGFDEGFWFDRFSAENALRVAFFLLFPVFYYVFLHGAYGQTFGKMALRIRVLNEDGTPLDYRKAFLRWLGYFLCDLTLNIGYLWAAFDPRKQGLHDKVCRTIVVHENARTGA